MKTKKTNLRKIKKNIKGITLIALVVTIIVLLILAGVALNLTIGQNGIFSRAQDAANTWKNSEANEQLALGEGANLIDSYLNGNDEGTALGNITGNEKENTKTKDKYGNPITIPAGFKVVNPNDDVTKGIIIEDVSAGDEYTKGSQFVWIPVGDIITDEKGSKTTITLGRYTFDNTGKETLVQSAENWNNNTAETVISDYYIEISNSEYGNATAKNLEAFINKSIENHGYYIGRYEAGDALATTSEREWEATDTNPVVCKAGVYPYNYVTQPQASSLAKGMYNSNNFEGDLVNSYAWDTAIVFIQRFSGDANYSIQGGENDKNAIQRCGENNLISVDSGDNTQDVRCNIYDMAGGTGEWTTETSTIVVCFAKHPCVRRLGNYSGFSASNRIQEVDDTERYDSSFRLILYL